MIVEMRYWLKHPGLIILCIALVSTLAVGVFIGVRRRDPPLQPVFTVKVGVLEDRKPSPNSKVWALAEPDEASATLVIEGRMKEIASEMDRLKSSFEKRATYAKMYKPTENVFNNDTAEIFNDYKRRMLVSSLAECDQEVSELLKESGAQHEAFLERLASTLNRASHHSGNTGMDGTVALAGLREREIVLYVLPAVSERFTFSRTKLDLGERQDVVVGLRRAPKIKAEE